MICPVCKGAGIHRMPHVPSDSGGWLNEKYIFGPVCSACEGSGHVPDGPVPAAVDEPAVIKIDEEASWEDLKRLARSGSPDQSFECPRCSSVITAKNLMRHCHKSHPYLVPRK